MLSKQWLLWAGLVLVAAGVGLDFNFCDPEKVNEVFLGMFLIGGLAAFPVWAHYLAGLDAGRRLLLVAMVGAIFAGHYAHQDLKTFPFVRWAMFTESSPKSVVKTEELQATLADGSRVQLNPERLFPSLGVGTHRLSVAIILRLNHALLKQDEKTTAKFNELLAAIAEAHNRFGNGASRVRSIDVIRVHRPIRKKAGVEKMEERVWRWEDSQ